MSSVLVITPPQRPGVMAALPRATERHNRAGAATRNRAAMPREPGVAAARKGHDVALIRF
jgi:hypothetical protein